MTAARLHPADLAEIVDMLRTTENLTPKQAIGYTGRCRTAVFEFMQAHPNACTIDADGIRRVRRRWLDAWCESRHALAAMERGAAA